MGCKKIGWDQIGSEGRWLTGGRAAPPQTPRAWVPLLQGRAGPAKGHGRGTPPKRCCVIHFTKKIDSHQLLVIHFAKIGSCQVSVIHVPNMASLRIHQQYEYMCMITSVKQFNFCCYFNVENIDALTENTTGTNLELGSLTRNELGLLDFRTDPVMKQI